MAKLLQILAKELKAWPKGKCKAIAQDETSCVFFWKNDDLVFEANEWHAREGSSLVEGNWSIDKKVELAEDYKTAIITKEMWEAEVAGTEIPSTECKQFNATELRDRIFQIKITVDALQKEHDAAVNKLAAEGFQLVPVAPSKDMENWRNWKAGDSVECVKESEGASVLTVGSAYAIGTIGTALCVTDDEGDRVARGVSEGCFKFVSRP